MKVLEVNVDDLHSGGVFSLIKNVIVNKGTDIKIDIGAIEQFVNIENIRMLDKYDCDVHYIGYDGSKWKKQIVCFKNLKKLLKSNNYDCVHIHADVANKLLVSAFAAKCVGLKKIIVHSHAAGVDGNHRVFKRYIHLMCRRLLAYVATDFVACSELAAEWMFPNIAKDHIVIINNGVDLDKFRFNPEIRIEERKRLGLQNSKIIGHVGRFAYQKNHEYLIKIMERLHEIDSSIKLLLVGEGPKEKEIHDLVKNKGLEDTIVFFGTSDSVNELFQAMDIFVLPSFFEGLPIVGVEAQAAGLPVIFSSLITSEAKITQNVQFLDIAEDNIDEWVRQILHEIGEKRYDTYQELKNRKFSIQDTIYSFLSLYKGE